MAAILNLCFLTLCLGIASAIPSYLYPVEHRGLEPSIAVISDNTPQYEYRLVPSNDYAVAEVYNPTDLTTWDLIPRIKTALVLMVKKVWAITTWVVTKGSLVLLGVALMLGFCTFTPFCTITFQKHSFLGRSYRTIAESGVINEIEDFFYGALDKFKNYQNDKIN